MDGKPLTNMLAPTAIRINACICTIFFALLSGCEKADTHKAVVPDTQKAVVAETPQAPKPKITESARKMAAAHNKQGLLYAGQENYRKAEEEFRKAVELDNRNPEYIYHLGLTLVHQKDTRDEAVAVFLKAIAMQPNAPEYLVLYHYNLACTYALQGKADKAYEHLEKLANFDSRSQFHLAQSDKDFDSIRNTPRFKQILEKIAQSGKSGEVGKPEQRGN